MDMLLLAIDSFFGDIGVDGGQNWDLIWLPLCILAVTTALVIYTILLMIGKALYLKELEAFAKSEILQTAATAFMAIFLVLMVNGAMVLTSQFIAGDLTCDGKAIHIPYAQEGQVTKGLDAMSSAFGAIRCRLQSRAVEVASIQCALEVGAGLDFNALNMQASIFGMTFFKGDWYDSLYSPVERKRITNNLATVLLIGLNAQSFLMDYIYANMLHVFIPVGILLRSFYFTRSVGALFISMGIGMYFIFPIFFVLLDPGFTAAAPPLDTLSGPEDKGVYCYPTMSATLSMVQSVESKGGNTITNLQMDQLNSDLSKAYVSLILHPLIAFFLTMVFIKYMMTVLGGDTYDLTRMVTKVV